MARMYKIGDKWIEEIEGKPHMVECVGMEGTDYPQSSFYRYGILIKTELRDIISSRPLVSDFPYTDSYYRYICKDLGVMTDEILSCPFCKSEVHIGKTSTLPMGTVECTFICTHCDTVVSIYAATVMGAVSKYNKRA